MILKPMKDMKKQLLLVFLMFLPLMVSAEVVEIDGLWYNIVSKAKVAEVSPSQGDEYSGEVEIPASVTYDGTVYIVSSIGSEAFSSCTVSPPSPFPIA